MIAPTAANASKGVAAKRSAVLERIARKLDKYLPESGELRPWTISEIESALLKDINEIARDVIEARLEVDLARVIDKPRCPDCGKSLKGLKHARKTHRQVIFGPIQFSRTYGICHACGVAFSPSGQRVGLRQGLL
jgi:hypothetical protein